jgi:hypothetical protein
LIGYQSSASVTIASSRVGSDDERVDRALPPGVELLRDVPRRADKGELVDKRVAHRGDGASSVASEET